VIVRPMKLYDFPTSLRVTVGRHEENQQFLEALQRVAASSLKAVRQG
jgi:histidinol-phosphate/aromatic aminotransferase/cobyric acid decarboxylase-like protein